MKYWITSIFLMTVLGVQCNLNAQSEKTKIETYLKQQEAKGFSGAVLVAYKGKQLLAQGYGHNNKEKGISNTAQSIFDIGSLTKQFTGAAILKLEMQGKLSVHDPIHKYLANVPEDKKEITIHHLLTHSAGLPGGIGGDYNAITEEEYLTKVYQLKLEKPFGKRYDYSNVGYSLLSIIVEKVSGLPYEQFLNKYLFVPAGMHQTGYMMPKWDAEQIAVGYRRGKAWGKPTEKKWADDSPYLHLKGNGGILSSVEDMYRWHKALLGTKILSEAAKAKYYQSHIEEGEGAGSYYGYGWAIFPTPRNTELIAHNGGNGVFFADFWRYLEEDIAIIFMTNQAGRKYESIAADIAAILLNLGKVEEEEPESTAIKIKESEVEAFSKMVFTAIRDGNETQWEELLTKHSTNEFRDIAPMKTHFKFLTKFQNRLSGGSLESWKMDSGEIIAQIKTAKETIELLIGLDLSPDGQLKVAGLMME